MSVSVQKLRAIAWFECRELVQSTADDQIEQLAAVVTRIAIAKDGAGFTPALTFPGDAGAARDLRDLVTNASDKSVKGTFNGKVLPSVAALWEVDSAKLPLETTVSIPADLTWIKDSTVVTLAEFKPGPDSSLDATRRFRLYQPPDLGASIPTAFVSSLTLTGLPTRAATRPSRRRLATFVAAMAALIFVWSAGCLNWSGKQFGQGIELLQGRRAAHDGELVVRHALQRGWDRDLIALDTCVPGMALTATAATSPAPSPISTAPEIPTTALSPGAKVACLRWWTVAMQIAHRGREPGDEALAFLAEPRVVAAIKSTKDADCLDKALRANPSFDASAIGMACGVLAQGGADFTAQASVQRAIALAKTDTSAAHADLESARQKLPVDRSLESRVFGTFSPDGKGSAASSATISLITPLVLMMASVLALVIAAGLGVMGLARGVFVSSQNRISLARCQVVAWSILVLPTAIAFACFNAGVIGQMSGDTSNMALFPSLPGAIWGALGISIGSSMLSPLLLSSKDSKTPVLQLMKGANHTINGDVSAIGDLPSKLSSNADESQASIGDLFIGEETGNDGQVDISRLQMLVITVGLVSTYADMIFARIGNISIAGLASALTAPDPGSLLSTLPEAGVTFTAMLAISHGAYLITKAASATPGTPANDTSKLAAARHERQN